MRFVAMPLGDNSGNAPTTGGWPFFDETRDRMTTVMHEIDGSVGVVTLAKPPHNVLDDQLINDLVAAYHAVRARRCQSSKDPEIT